jgi:hypothetical protein
MSFHVFAAMCTDAAPTSARRKAGHENSARCATYAPAINTGKMLAERNGARVTTNALNNFVKRLIFGSTRDSSLWGSGVVTPQ